MAAVRTRGRTVGRRPLERVVTGHSTVSPAPPAGILVAIVTNGHDAEIIVAPLIAGTLFTTRALALRDHLRRGFFIGGAARFETHQAINEHTGTDCNGDVSRVLDRATRPARPRRCCEIPTAITPAATSGATKRVLRIPPLLDEVKFVIPERMARSWLMESPFWLHANHEIAWPL